MTYAQSRLRFEKDYWTALVKLCGSNAKMAAQIAGVNRTDFYKRIRRYNIPFESKSRCAHRGNWDRELPTDAPRQFSTRGGARLPKHGSEAPRRARASGPRQA